MLTEAVKNVKELVFDETKPKTDAQIQNELAEISTISEVDSNTLTAFFNFFSGLKMDMDRKGLKTTKNLDWSGDQVAIMMLFMEERKQEKMGVEDAFKNLATVLDKSKSGVQYKYYETLKAQKVPKNGDKKETRGRKPKNQANLTAIKGGKKDETPDAVGETPTILPQVEQFDNPIENEKTNDISVPKDTLITKNSSREMLEEAPRETFRSGREIEAPIQERQVSRSTSEDVDVADLITGMIQDFGIIGKTKSSAIEANETILDLFKGLRSLSSLAALNSNSSIENTTLKEELALERKRAQSLDEENIQLMRHFNEMATIMQEFNELDQVQRLGNWKAYMQALSDKVKNAGGIPEPRNNTYSLDKNLNLVRK